MWNPGLALVADLIDLSFLGGYPLLSLLLKNLLPLLDVVIRQGVHRVVLVVAVLYRVPTPVESLQNRDNLQCQS